MPPALTWPWACRWTWAARGLCGSSALLSSSLTAALVLPWCKSMGYHSLAALRARCVSGTCLPSFPLAEAWGNPAGHASQKSFEFWFMQPASIISPMVEMLYFIFRVNWIWTNTVSYPLLEAKLPLLLLAKRVWLLGLSFVLCGIYILLWRSFTMQMHLTSSEWSMLDAVCLCIGVLEESRFSPWYIVGFTLAPRMDAFLCTL